VVSFEVTFEGVKWWWDSDSSRCMVQYLGSSRGDSTIIIILGLHDM